MASDYPFDIFKLFFFTMLGCGSMREKFNTNPTKNWYELWCSGRVNSRLIETFKATVSSFQYYKNVI
jgi:hypothetical protein